MPVRFKLKFENAGSQDRALKRLGTRRNSFTRLAVAGDVTEIMATRFYGHGMPCRNRRLPKSAILVGRFDNHSQRWLRPEAELTTSMISDFKYSKLTFLLRASQIHGISGFQPAFLSVWRPSNEP